MELNNEKYILQKKKRERDDLNRITGCCTVTLWLLTPLLDSRRGDEWISVIGNGRQQMLKS